MHMRTLHLIVCICALSAAVSGTAKEKRPGPLLDGLGTLHHPVTTSSKLAQRYFDQGLLLAYAFNHKEAIRAFRSAAAVDPSCAMAHWGVALACGPHVNSPMSADDNTNAWAALQRALQAQSDATPRERAYIAALAARYTAVLPTNRAALDKAYADAMRDLVKQYPDDLDAHTLFAEALMDTMPWDYWLKDRSPKPETIEAFNALRFVLARNPDHPGANHYYIHAVEAGPNPEWGLPSADRLLNFAPAAGHLVHMPSHIYMRVGHYHNAAISNERAVKADRSYLKQSREQGFYPGVYYPHNIHFLWWAELFQGRSKEALKTADKAAQYAVDNYCGPSKAFEAPRFRHLPWLTHMRFGNWNSILSVPQPAMTNDFLFDRAIWHFTRGLAFVAASNTAAAVRENAALVAIADGEAIRKLDSPQLPVSGIVEVAKQWLAGRVAGLQGDNKTMIQHLEKAVTLEDALPYMEPAYWPLPVRPALAAAHLRSGDAANAERIFREDLRRMPRNGWALFGLQQALHAQGRDDSAEVIRRQFNETWKRADTQLDLAAY
jgi:tetratricopeptide (TPR) repeat protein